MQLPTTLNISNQASNLGTAAICSGINCGGKFLLYCWFQEGEEGFQGQVEGQEQHQGEWRKIVEIKFWVDYLITVKVNKVKNFLLPLVYFNPRVDLVE